MGWYPGARKLELQPESDAQAAIQPTQFILHSIAAPWTVQRIYEYWRDSTNLESHFGLAYDGDLGQFIGTQTRADANASANSRAVSLESASNLEHTDPWTPAQLEEIVKLGVWLHQAHNIPLRVCRSATDPGYGYHGLFAEWSLGGTACPGQARIDQFWNYVFPEIKRRAEGAPPTNAEDDMPLTPDDLHNIAVAVTREGTPNLPQEIARAVAERPEFKGLFAAITALTAQLPGVDTKTVVKAVQDAIAAAVVKVDVHVD